MGQVFRTAGDFFLYSPGYCLLPSVFLSRDFHIVLGAVGTTCSCCLTVIYINITESPDAVVNLLLSGTKWQS